MIYAEGIKTRRLVILARREIILQLVKDHCFGAPANLVTA